MTTPTSSKIKMVARAALFSIVAVGGMSLGLGATTYTVAMANDYVMSSVKADSAPIGSDPASCLFE